MIALPLLLPWCLPDQYECVIGWKVLCREKKKNDAFIFPFNKAYYKFHATKGMQKMSIFQVFINSQLKCRYQNGITLSK